MKKLLGAIALAGLLAGCASDTGSGRGMTATVNGTEVGIGSGVDRVVRGTPDANGSVVNDQGVTPTDRRTDEFGNEAGISGGGAPGTRFDSGSVTTGTGGGRTAGSSTATPGGATGGTTGR